MCLDQSLLVCLEYAYLFSIPEPEYAYKRYAYKKRKPSTTFRRRDTYTLDNM